MKTDSINLSSANFGDTVISSIENINQFFRNIITDPLLYISILLLITIYCILLIFWRQAANVISFTFFRPLNRTITQYFASSNTLLFISFVWFFIAMVISHEVWIQTGEIDKPLLIMGGGAAIASYFLNSGIKLHAEMRDNAFTLIKEIKKEELADAIREINKYFTQKCNENSLKAEEWFKNGLSEQDVKELETNENLSKKINLIANYFEEIAISIRHREAHESLLEISLVNIFIMFYKGIKNSYIPIKRNKASAITDEVVAQKIYSNMEYLYDRWHPVDDRTTWKGIINNLKTKILTIKQISVAESFKKIIKPNSLYRVLSGIIIKLLYVFILSFTILLILWFFSCHGIANRLIASTDEKRIFAGCFEKHTASQNSKIE